MSNVHHLSNSVDTPQLRTYVERVERLHEERKAISDDISGIYKEAKGNGFDVPALKEVVKKRAVDPSKRTAHEEMVDLYWSHVGRE